MRLPQFIRLAVPALVFTILSSCEKETPYDRNRSVRPNDFLSADTYTSLTVEIVYVDEVPLQPTSIANLKEFLTTLLNKPSGISFIERSIPSPNIPTYSPDMLRQFEFENRSLNTEEDRLTAYIYVTNGEYSGSSADSKILGVAYDYSSMAIFEESLQEFSGGPGRPSAAKMETTVLEHEFSHILGLVNNGTPLVDNHHDDEHEGHCDNPDCLMYYLAETSDIADNLFGVPAPTLDANCRADLQANGGK
jgi:hypothetical protein